jgi:predicted DsbA family dithiol-disulfide isomerase
MTVEVRYYTDPACPRSWGAEPELRRLMWEFAGGLRFTWVMGGLAREYSAAEHPALVAEWLDLTAETGMPTDPRLWLRNPIASSHPACQAVKAATEQGSEAGYAYLRRVREGLMVERRKLDHAEALVAEAGPAGLDVDRFRIDLDSNATVGGAADNRSPSRDARGRGAVRACRDQGSGGAHGQAQAHRGGGAVVAGARVEAAARGGADGNAVGARLI